MITEELENDLRCAFVRAGAGIEVPDAVRARLCERNYRPRRLHRSAVGAVGAIGTVVAATAAGIAVPLAAGGGPQAAASGARIRLDSYTFTMPAGYHAAHRRCPLAIGINVPPTGRGKAHVPGVGMPKVPTTMRAAASADGGCVGLLLSPSYRSRPGSPDPYALAGSQPVRVGDHNGLLFKVLSYHLGPDGTMVRMRPGMLDLFVPLPTRGGKVRDLVIGSNKLTRRELITIAISGLRSSS